MKEGGGFSFASFKFVLKRLLLQAIVYRAQNFRTIEARCLYRPEVYSAQVFDTHTEAFDAIQVRIQYAALQYGGDLVLELLEAGTGSAGA